MRQGLIVSMFMLASTGCAMAQALSPDERTTIDTAIQATVTKTNVASVSVGIARGGNVVYAKAFGNAIIKRFITAGGPKKKDFREAVLVDFDTPADSAIPYPIRSISKQFTAACILILQEQGKLKLDDPVSTWFPEFTRSKEVTIANLLTHTSGYSDYAPQDYTIPAWTHPINSYKLIKEWATKPLDFDPGTKWQYSNTNFQMAALIIEKASGQKYHDFLWANVITPLKLHGVLDLDTDRDKLQVHGYERHAMGPLRPAILEAPGWYTGDGGLAMPVATLMEWDESIVHRTLLKPESYDAMEADFKLKDGSSTGYGFGLSVRTIGGKRFLSHSGEVGGFVSNNVVAIDDDVAYAALTNIEGPGAGAVTSALRPILLPATISAAKPVAVSEADTAKPPFPPAQAKQTKSILTGLQNGKIDRKLFTSDTNYYFSKETLGDYQTSLQPLGAIESVSQIAEELRGGMVFRVYSVKLANGNAMANTYTQKDGKIEQFLVDAE